jgi:hypothetical protein
MSLVADADMDLWIYEEFGSRDTQHHNTIV